MATGIDVSALTLNPKESEEYGKFVIERVFEQPQLNAIHRVWTGVKMKEQIVFASLFGKTGIKDSTCTRPTSGAKSTLTQKYWEPAKVGDTLVNCQSEISALFKAYYTKINEYKDLFDITGSDEELFLLTMMSDSAMKAVMRLAWFGDTNVAAAGAAAAGLAAAGNVKYYDAIDGIWKKVFAGVASTDVKRYEITENAGVTPAAQMTLAAGRAVEIFEGVWANADPRLKADANKRLMVNNAIWENYRQYLQGKGENFTIQYTTDGFRELMWNGVKVVNMEVIWDLDLFADFVDNTTNNAYYLPNRVILTVPDNIPVATLNEGDMDTIESWYEKKERQNYSAYGFTLDALYLEGYMISVAY